MENSTITIPYILKIARSCCTRPVNKCKTRKKTTALYIKI
ncbi:hypothetical protein CF65_01969 [Aggregatibacter actinomycetemcomitans HK1651]|nr:hypothetical protein CF65_01969 [Aggregatibacter actinomycetemcomitans HK1651]